ncbi:MAG: YicC family protein, partial [Deltaproteobacteria bacterium]|nr:YicC family protein [Deltaproteobacteria bacterium]
MKYPASMTSFGRGDVSDGTLGWTVEVRSVNHKF